MTSKSLEIEDSITKAIDLLDSNPRMKMAEAARRCNAPYDRLRHRRQGRKSTLTRGGHNKKLSEPQDSAIKAYLLLLFGLGTAANLDNIVIACNRVLYYSGSTESVSRRWAKRWIVRNNDYWKTLRSKPISSKRRDAHKVDDINEHFRAYQRCIKYWRVQESDIYNFDETGFQIGVVVGDRVIVPRDCDTVWISDPENRELVTAIITINCKGQKVPPMIIFKGAYHLRKNFDNDLDGDILFARSESGFTTDRLGLKYIEHFDRFTKKSTIGLYRVIIFDSYSSHVTQDFIDYC
jgi:hypothetical protein